MDDRKILDPETADEIKKRWTGILDHTEDEYSELAEIEAEHVERLRALRERQAKEPFPEEEYEAELQKLMLDTHKRTAKIHISAETRAADAYGDDVQAISEQIKKQIYDYANRIYNEAVTLKEAGREFQRTYLRVTDDGEIFLDRETVLDDFRDSVVIRELMKRFAQDMNTTKILDRAMLKGLKQTYKCNNVGILGAIINEEISEKSTDTAERFQVKPIKQYIFLNSLSVWSAFHSGIGKTTDIKKSDYNGLRVEITGNIEPLNPFDFAVYNALSTLWMNENFFVSVIRIEKVLTGNKQTRATEKRKQDIIKSITKMNSVKVHAGTVSGMLLRLYPQKGILSGKQTEGLRFHEAPFFYGLTENARKRIKVSREAWDLSKVVRMTDTKIILRDYVFRRILQAGKNGETKILFSSVLKEVGKNNLNRMQVSRVKGDFKKILSHFSDMGLCMWKQYKENNKEIGVIVWCE